MKTMVKTMILIFVSAILPAVSPLAQETKESPLSGTFEKKTENARNEDAAEKKREENRQATADELPEAISDNSFLIEEAYNQEPGVMQTIATCAWFPRPTGDVACSLTQEFPVGSQKHQFSYTVPFSFLDSNATRGVGDVLVNYRYQLTGEASRATIAPRFSLILPTGSSRRGLGFGTAGVQFNLPVSKRLNKNFAAHFNAGATFLPRAKGFDESGRRFRRNLSMYNVGGSLVYLAHKNFNLLGEYLENFQSEIDETGRVDRFQEHLVNPGARFAINLKSLQIVPGISFPVNFSRGERRSGVFFYLSFEHPFKKSKD